MDNKKKKKTIIHLEKEGDERTLNIDGGILELTEMLTMAMLRDHRFGMVVQVAVKALPGVKKMGVNSKTLIDCQSFPINKNKK